MKSQRLTHEELAQAHDRGDWDTLWKHAIPLTYFAVRRLVETGKVRSEFASDDMVQEGLLAAGQAVRTWDPLLGAFSTWVMPRVAGALMNHICAEAGGMVGSRAQRSEVVEFDDAVPADTDSPFPSPEAFAAQEQLAQDVATALAACRDPEDEAILRAVYGIGVPEQSVAEYAREKGMSVRSAYNHLTSARKNFAQKLLNL